MPAIRPWLRRLAHATRSTISQSGTTQSTAGHVRDQLQDCIAPGTGPLAGGGEHPEGVAAPARSGEARLERHQTEPVVAERPQGGLDTGDGVGIFGDTPA
jgi:hypothetical protein